MQKIPKKRTGWSFISQQKSEAAVAQCEMENTLEQELNLLAGIPERSSDLFCVSSFAMGQYDSQPEIRDD